MVGLDPPRDAFDESANGGGKDSGGRGPCRAFVLVCAARCCKYSCGATGMRLSRSFALPLRPPARTEMRPGPPFAFGRNGLHSRSPGCVLLLDRCGLSGKDSPSASRATRSDLEMTEEGWRGRRGVNCRTGACCQFRVVCSVAEWNSICETCNLRRKRKGAFKNGNTNAEMTQGSVMTLCQSGGDNWTRTIWKRQW